MTQGCETLPQKFRVVVSASEMGQLECIANVERENDSLRYTEFEAMVLKLKLCKETKSSIE